MIVPLIHPVSRDAGKPSGSVGLFLTLKYYFIRKRCRFQCFRREQGFFKKMFPVLDIYRVKPVK